MDRAGRAKRRRRFGYIALWASMAWVKYVRAVTEVNVTALPLRDAGLWIVVGTIVGASFPTHPSIH